MSTCTNNINASTTRSKESSANSNMRLYDATSTQKKTTNNAGVKRSVTLFAQQLEQLFRAKSMITHPFVASQMVANANGTPHTRTLLRQMIARLFFATRRRTSSYTRNLKIISLKHAIDHYPHDQIGRSLKTFRPNYTYNQ